MKPLLKILIHPVTICLFFCFLIISGESSAAFYGIALIFGSMVGAYHSVLGLAGMLLLLFSPFVSRPKWNHIADITGVISIVLSLIRFFTQPGGSYNYNTFRESLPLALIIIFSIVLLMNIVYHLCMLRNNKPLSQ